MMRQAFRTAGLVTATALAAACESSTAPEVPTLADLEGNFTASHAVYTSAADANISRDVLAAGGAYTLQVHPGGQFTTTLERPGSTHLVRTGTLQVSGNRLAVTEKGATRMVEFSLEGDVLTLNDPADTFDFGDGSEAARFEATLSR
jgi:hypothetical protein